MRVLLVHPPYQESTYCTPPLGISYIAAVLKTEGHEVKIVDAPPLSYTYSDIGKEVESFSPDIVGITSTTPLIRAALKTAEVVKSTTDSTVVIGGPHASIMPEETASQTDIDIVVRGEGEKVMQELVGALEKGEYKHVRGITFEKNGKIINKPPMPLIENLDKLPFPARELLPMGKYKQHTGHSTSFTTMITSRGCPNNCIYCTKAIFGRKYRYRSAENIINEIEHVVDEYKVKETVFYDDTITANRRRLMELCDSLIKRNIEIEWKCESRIDTVDEELLEKMHAAGCRVIAYGVESGNDGLLEVLKKNIALDDIRRTFKATKQAGMETLAYIMVGIPGETRKTIQNTLEFTIELDPDYVQFSFATPYPKSELYDIALMKGYIGENDWSEYAYTGDKATPVMRTDELSKEDLEFEMRRIIRKFYLRPEYILKKLKKSTSPEILKRNVSGLRSVLKWI